MQLRCLITLIPFSFKHRTFCAGATGKVGKRVVRSSWKGKRIKEAETKRRVELTFAKDDRNQEPRRCVNGTFAAPSCARDVLGDWASKMAKDLGTAATDTGSGK